MEAIHESNGRVSPPLSPAPAALLAGDRLRTLLRRLAGQVLAEAAELPTPERPVVVVAGDETLAITILLASATTKEDRPLTPCERDILALLETATCRMSRTRVVTELDRRGLVHGESTIGRALTSLAYRGIIQANRVSPRGYQMPGKRLPLWHAEGGPS